MSTPKTLYDKIWESHAVHEYEDGTALLYIDQHLLHEVSTPQAFEGLANARRHVHRVDATLAVADHNTPTSADRSDDCADPDARLQLRLLRANTTRFGITYLGFEDRRQGIAHIVGPELGATHPGMTIVCVDTRECLAIDAAGSIRSRRVIEVLTRLISVHGAPHYLRSGNGPEFVSRALLEWLVQSCIETAPIDPGKPWQNGADESFNGKLRDECVSLEWFRSRDEARVVIENWRCHYNAVRLHSGLGYLTPHAFKQQHHPTTNRAVFQE